MCAKIDVYESIRGLVATSPSRSDHREFDKESQQRYPARQWRIPRVRRVAVCLFLIDVLVVGLLVYSIEPLITLLRRNHELFEPQFEVDRSSNQTSLSSHHENQNGPQIPKIFHQTTATADIPDQWVYPQHTCMEAYHDFEYKLWTDATAREFIAKEYPWFLDIWDNYPFPIQRADSIRYFVLHHYGGIYLDMDTLCEQAFPVEDIQTQGHYALYKSTRPTGITNDFMVATARHPAYTAAITKLPVFYGITQLWARLEPYTAIMLSSGPLFLTLVVKDYLLGGPSLPSPTVEVIDASMLRPYITDLESATWHRMDTQVLMWMGERPWSWFGLGLIGLVLGVYVFNRALLMLYRAPRRLGSTFRKIRKFLA